MILFILTIILFIIGILLILVFLKSDSELSLELGVSLSVVFGILLITETILILTKPFEYKKFKIKYDTIKIMETSKNDIRDASYTQNLIHINGEIMKNREFVNSKWVGIFYDKKIAKLELLEKGGNND